MEVILVKTTKWGKEFKKAGDPIEVSPEQKKDLLKRGIILDETAPVAVDNKETETLKADKEALKKEVETLKADKEALKKEVETLKADKGPTEKDGKDDLLGKGK